MPAELKAKRSSSSKPAKRDSESGHSRKKSTKGQTGKSSGGGAELPEALLYLGGKHRGARRCAQYCEKFDELTTVIAASNPALRALATAEASAKKSSSRLSSSAVPGGVSSSSSTALPSDNAFPILSVGYLARAMGLNVSNEQVATLIELVEEEGPSSGFVDKRKLQFVVVDTLMTGTLGGPTLRNFAVLATASADKGNEGKIAVERLEQVTPSLCVRDDEATLYRAFETLDVDQRGYLEFEDLRSTMMTEGEPFSSAELQEMWMSMHDSETNRIYYRDFADVLARE